MQAASQGMGSTVQGWSVCVIKVLHLASFLLATTVTLLGCAKWRSK